MGGHSKLFWDKLEGDGKRCGYHHGCKYRICSKECSGSATSTCTGPGRRELK